jgi:hypothetical protein
MSTLLEQSEFTVMLKAFNELVESNPTISKVKDELNGMKEAAIASDELNARQKDAIVDRCNHYLNGTYGNTKKAENFGH